MLDYGVEAHRSEVHEAKNIGIRNPAFDGDMIGWLDDDFDEDDEDDKNNSTQKPT